MLQNMKQALPLLWLPHSLSASMNDCGELGNVGTLPISAAAEYGRDGRMTNGLNGVRV